jgi:glucokinase
MASLRPLVALENARPPFYVGVDLGGTTVKLGLVDNLGQTIAWDSIATDVEAGPEDAAARMGAAVLRLVRSAGLEPPAVARVGLGSPGTLDIPAGVMINPMNFPGWGGFPIRDRLAAHSGLPVAFVNDASAAAYGEFWVGSGREFHSMVLLTLGTGVGCGIIIGNLIIEGEHGFGTECGHIIIDFDDHARACPCGQAGHLEAYASANAVIKRTEEALDSGRASSIRRRIAEGRELSPLLVAEEAEAGDALAEEIVIQTGRYLGIGIVTLVHTIDPSGVLLGGAMTFGGPDSQLGQRFLEAVRREFRRRTFPVLAEKTVIDWATLGADAGYLGAAGIARLEHEKAQSPVAGRQLTRDRETMV